MVTDDRGGRGEPPSYQAGPSHFPTGSLPVAVTSDPARLLATAGSSSQASITFTPGVGAFGDTAVPASGTTTVANGTATATVSFAVATNAPQGFGSVGFTVSADMMPMPMVPGRRNRTVATV